MKHEARPHATPSARRRRPPPPALPDADRVHEVLGAHLLVDGFPLVFDLEASHGSWIVDARTGERYLDFFSFFASLPVGFNHPDLLQPVWKRRLLRAALQKPSNSDAYTRELAGFVETFSELAAHPAFPHLFFIESGTLAVENALKTAFDWKARKNRAAGRDVPGSRILHFREAFHGRSGYSLSLTNTDPVKTDLFPKFDWPRVENPKMRFPANTEAEEKRIALAEELSLGQIEDAFRRHPHDIAAIIIETIQGEGGDNHFRPEFLQALRKVADREEAMLIFDEVQCGFGITGRMWAFQQHYVQPDIVAFGKKSQVCGIMVSKRVDEVPDNVFRVPSRINSTWGGNLADMVRCEAYLRIMDREELVRKAGMTGNQIFLGLHEIASRTGKIDNGRGRGLMLAFDLPTPEMRAALLKKCLEERMIVLPCGPRSIRLRPALSLNPAEAMEGLDRLERAIGKL